jgi:glucose/arabinose dehydrogenase
MHLRLAFLLLTLLVACKQEKEKKVSVVLKPDPDNGGLFLPEGFGALVVVDSIGQSRHMAVNSNGDIYVKLRITTGEMLDPIAGNAALRDTDGDGKADIVQRFGNYPNDGPFGTEMRIHQGYLYFSTENVVYRQPLTPPLLVPNSPPEIIYIDRHPPQYHNAKSLAFDGKGNMYVTLSAPTNACEDWNTVPEGTVVNVKGESPCPDVIEQAIILKLNDSRPTQYQEDGVRFAMGLRSIVGLAWNESDSALYGLVHGRDYLREHAPQHYNERDNATLPAEEFVLIREGEDYGWPYAYYDASKKKRMLAPEYGGNGKKEAKGYALPIMGLPAHWAPNDLLFYKGRQFPDRYRHGAFVAFHGSTNRGPYPQAGYIVAFIPFENGRPMDRWEVFADGFTRKDTLVKMSDARFRPMGLAEGPDGSLYIVESKIGRIWRVMFTGNRDTFGEAQLDAMEKRKSLSYLRAPE